MFFSVFYRFFSECVFRVFLGPVFSCFLWLHGTDRFFSSFCFRFVKKTYAKLVFRIRKKLKENCFFSFFFSGSPNRKLNQTEINRKKPNRKSSSVRFRFKTEKPESLTKCIILYKNYVESNNMQNIIKMCKNVTQKVYRFYQSTELHLKSDHNFVVHSKNVSINDQNNQV